MERPKKKNYAIRNKGWNNYLRDKQFRRGYNIACEDWETYLKERESVEAVEKVISLKLSQLIVDDSKDSRGYTKSYIIATALHKYLTEVI